MVLKIWLKDIDDYTSSEAMVMQHRRASKPNPRGLVCDQAEHIKHFCGHWNFNNHGKGADTDGTRNSYKCGKLGNLSKKPSCKVPAKRWKR